MNSNDNTKPTQFISDNFGRDNVQTTQKPEKKKSAWMQAREQGPEAYQEFLKKNPGREALRKKFGERSGGFYDDELEEYIYDNEDDDETYDPEKYDFDYREFFDNVIADELSSREIYDDYDYLRKTFDLPNARDYFGDEYYELSGEYDPDARRPGESWEDYYGVSHLFPDRHY